MPVHFTVANPCELLTTLQTQVLYSAVMCVKTPFFSRVRIGNRAVHAVYFLRSMSRMSCGVVSDST